VVDHPLGSGAPGVISMGCLTWKCRGTPIGEEKISEYSSMTLSTFFLLCGEIGRRGPGCGCDLSLTLRENHEEEKFPSLRDDLPALLGRDQGNSTRRDCLGYPVQFLCSK
jgi:hypothetical protein